MYIHTHVLLDTHYTYAHTHLPFFPVTLSYVDPKVDPGHVEGIINGHLGKLHRLPPTLVVPGESV